MSSPHPSASIHDNDDNDDVSEFNPELELAVILNKIPSRPKPPCPNADSLEKAQYVARLEVNEGIYREIQEDFTLLVEMVIAKHAEAVKEKRRRGRAATGAGSGSAPKRTAHYLDDSRSLGNQFSLVGKILGTLVNSFAGSVAQEGMQRQGTPASRPDELARIDSDDVEGFAIDIEPFLSDKLRAVKHEAEMIDEFIGGCKSSKHTSVHKVREYALTAFPDILKTSESEIVEKPNKGPDRAVHPNIKALFYRPDGTRHPFSALFFPEYDTTKAEGLFQHEGIGKMGALLYRGKTDSALSNAVIWGGIPDCHMISYMAQCATLSLFVFSPDCEFHVEGRQTHFDYNEHNKTVRNVLTLGVINGDKDILQAVSQFRRAVMPGKAAASSTPTHLGSPVASLSLVSSAPSASESARALLAQLRLSSNSPIQSTTAAPVITSTVSNDSPSQHTSNGTAAQESLSVTRQIHSFLPATLSPPRTTITISTPDSPTPLTVTPFVSAFIADTPERSILASDTPLISRRCSSASNLGNSTMRRSPTALQVQEPEAPDSEASMGEPVPTLPAPPQPARRSTRKTGGPQAAAAAPAKPVAKASAPKKSGNSGKGGKGVGKPAKGAQAAEIRVASSSVRYLDTGDD